MGHVIFTCISKINSVYGNLQDQMKLDLCICEALSYTWYHGSRICGRGYQLPLISIKPIFENISWKAGQKMTVACYQTCYTKGSIHESIWKNQQPPKVFLQDAK